SLSGPWWQVGLGAFGPDGGGAIVGHVVGGLAGAGIVRGVVQVGGEDDARQQGVADLPGGVGVGAGGDLEVVRAGRERGNLDAAVDRVRDQVAVGGVLVAPAVEELAVGRVRTGAVEQDLPVVLD